MITSLKNLQVILVRAENPVNIGQSARAMKNFGLSKLLLVKCAPHRVDQAYTPGWKARKILDQAVVYQRLEEAINQTTLAVGLTCRKGDRRGEPRSLIEVVSQILDTLKHQKVALFFGNEKNGLSNQEIAKCHVMATIPVGKEYSSLNLSHAVAISAFSVFSQTRQAKEFLKRKAGFYPKVEEFEALMDDFYRVLEMAGYRNGPGKVDMLDKILFRLEHYFKKTGLDKRELCMFKALLHRIEQKIKKVK